MKTCTKCGATKSMDEFSTEGKYRKGACKPCHSQSVRERYARGGAVSRAYKRRQTAALRAVRVPIINALKMERGCIDCGYNAHPAALHFDHHDPSLKDFTIAKSVTLSMARVMAEIAKCDVRCANCHAIRSVNEGHLGRPRIEETA